MQSASGWSQLEKRAKEAEGARSGMTRRSSWEGSMLGGRQDAAAEAL